MNSWHVEIMAWPRAVNLRSTWDRGIHGMATCSQLALFNLVLFSSCKNWLYLTNYQLNERVNVRPSNKKQNKSLLNHSLVHYWHKLFNSKTFLTDYFNCQHIHLTTIFCSTPRSPCTFSGLLCKALWAYVFFSFASPPWLAVCRGHSELAAINVPCITHVVTSLHFKLFALRRAATSASYVVVFRKMPASIHPAPISRSWNI